MKSFALEKQNSKPVVHPQHFVAFVIMAFALLWFPLICHSVLCCVQLRSALFFLVLLCFCVEDFIEVPFYIEILPYVYIFEFPQE